MRADKLDEGGFELVGKVDDEPILVAADIENGPVVSKRFDTRCRAVFPLEGIASRKPEVPSSLSRS
jgi:hypothetical protein